MAFGLQNALQTFQRFISQSKGGLVFAFTYLDGILIGSKNQVEHETYLKELSSRLEQCSLTNKPNASLVLVLLAS